MVLTKHAMQRMRQRGIRVQDVDLIEWIGTPVRDGYLVRTKDCQAVEREIKKFLDRIRRLKGKRLVAVEGRIFTAFHASRRQERLLLRYSPESDQE